MQNTANYLDLFLNDTPMLDVRAPVEFNKGAFPLVKNLPLMTDDERTLVGTCYKKEGQDAAIALGHSLVNGAVKAERVAQWVAFFKQHPQSYLYCFRGGLRSRLTQQWLAEAGVNIPFVVGGYKALRGFLLSQLHDKIRQGNILILAGPTGSGKTEVIADWPHSVDLEGLANHRGSAFGKTQHPQPSQIDFENSLAIQWLKKTQQFSGPILFEDESRLIGRIALLPEFLALSKTAGIVVLQASLEQRIQRIRSDYFQHAYQSQQHLGSEAAELYLDDFIRSALTRIKKRLGGVRFQSLIALLDQAMNRLRSQNSWQGFDAVIESLLSDYYDPMYEYQFNAKKNAKRFTGHHQEILQWLDSHSSP